MRLAAALVVLLMAAPVWAYDATGALPEPAQEERARELFRELRCMVCQNQSIDDSDAPLARDLRTLVRERVAAGESNTEIKAFLVDRYGEFVLLRPRFDEETLVLWLAPAVLLAGAACVSWMAFRRRRREGGGHELTESEQQKLKSILDQDG